MTHTIGWLTSHDDHDTPTSPSNSRPEIGRRSQKASDQILVRTQRHAWRSHGQHVCRRHRLRPGGERCVVHVIGRREHGNRHDARQSRPYHSKARHARLRPAAPADVPDQVSRQASRPLAGRRVARRVVRAPGSTPAVDQLILDVPFNSGRGNASSGGSYHCSSETITVQGLCVPHLPSHHMFNRLVCRFVLPPYTTDPYHARTQSLAPAAGSTSANFGLPSWNLGGRA